MLIGLICATNDEIALLKDDMHVSSIEEIGNRIFYIGNLYGRDTVLVRSNIGKVAAALTTTLMIDKFKVDKIIFTGTAGGIAQGLHIGDVVIAESLVQHDFDCIGCEPFTIPIILKSHFDTEKDLSESGFRAAEKYFEGEYIEDVGEDILNQFNIVSPKVIMGVVASGDIFVSSEDRKKELIEKIDNLKCVEMEGAAAAQVANEFNVPIAVFRILSDTAGEEGSIDYNAFVEKASSLLIRGIIKSLFTL